MAPRQTLITSALPYANGDIHIGHLVEYIQTDIYVRYLRMKGEDVIYLCASDSHGTPIEISASKQGVSPEELVAKYNKEHQEDFASFQISFDFFYTTHSPETQHHSETIYEELNKRGLIYTKELDGTYCEHCSRYLPDRYIRGTCPKCGSEDQYGDICEICNSTIEPNELIAPRCAICGQKPARKSSIHYFFKLSQCQKELEKWVRTKGRLQKEIRAYVEGWLKEGLRDWDISRDAPYFGFTIPGEQEKYFYVWLDAPVGYIGTTEKYCQLNGRDFYAYWKIPDTRIIHFIGKDISYFHTLFWPAMLMNSNYNLPHKVQVHGMLTVNGEKMSKSRGTSVKAKTYLRFMDPQYLRYYYASKLGPHADDIDLNLEDFVLRVNADLINKVANLASRAIPFVHRKLDGRLGRIPQEGKDFWTRLAPLLSKVEKSYNSFEFGKALRDISEIADIANKYFQDAEPWTYLKEDPDRAREICTVAINFLKVISILIKPVLPQFSADVEKMLHLGDLKWSDLSFDLEEQEIGPFERLVERVERDQVFEMIEASKEGETGLPSGPDISPPLPEISIEEFSKVDLRVALVKKAETVKGADKLLKLTVDVGNQEKTVFAGIKSSYKPEELVGLRVLVVVNLKPRKMKFGTSEAMILAALSGDGLVITEFDESAIPGSQVR